MKPQLLAVLVALAGAAAQPAVALEFRSVGVRAGVMFDGPSQKAKKVFVASQDYPVEVLVRLAPEWVKVRDAAGDFAWIEAKELSDKRTVLVTTADAEVRENPDDPASVLFRAEKDVVLDLVEPPTGLWAKVRHRDGQTGYIRIDQIWGV